MRALALILVYTPLALSLAAFENPATHAATDRATPRYTHAISNQQQREALVWSQARPRDASPRGRPRGFEPRPGRRTYTKRDGPHRPAPHGSRWPAHPDHTGARRLSRHYSTDDERRGRPSRTSQPARGRRPGGSLYEWLRHNRGERLNRAVGAGRALPGPARLAPHHGCSLIALSTTH